MSDFLRALIIPLSMVIVFLFWLIYHGMVLKYWLSNYIFNLYIPDVYGNLVEPTKPEFYVVSFIALIGSLYFLVKGNICQRILSILWIAEALQRFFYFSLDRHYYYQLQVLNAIMAGAILWVIVKKYNLLEKRDALRQIHFPDNKEMLDDMHKRKIDMADAIYVINVNGYIGESTRCEIEYAKRHCKVVEYLEPYE